MTSLRTILLLLYFCILSFTTFAQNVTILPGGITPNQGSTYPRLSYDEIASLTSPQKGDIAYDLTFDCMRLYNGSKWVRLVSDDDLNIPSTTAWSAGGSIEDAGLGVATDSSGNVFVTGYFQNTATFGDTSVSSAGYRDIFVAKYNNTGSLQWVQTAGGPNGNVSNCIAVDKNGDVVIAGYFYTSCDFNGTMLTSNGGADIFVAKYSNSGELLWVEQGKSSEVDAAIAITIDKDDNIYVTGYFGAIATFGTSTLSHSGAADIFVAKYNSSGVLQWLQKSGSSGTEVGNGIAVDTLGAVYLTGYYSSTTLDFGTTTLTLSGTRDIFVAKFDPITSTWVWAKKAGGAGDDRGVGIAINPNSSNLCITGLFSTTLTMGSNSVVSEGMADGFIATYDTDGNPLWVKRYGGSSDDEGKKVAFDTNGDIYMTGYFGGTASFEKEFVTSAGDIDICIAKYSSTGILQWVQRYGGSNGDAGAGITLDNNNNIYATGTFQLSTKFGSVKLTSGGDTEIFVARIKE